MWAERNGLGEVPHLRASQAIALHHLAAAIRETEACKRPGLVYAILCKRMGIKNEAARAMLKRFRRLGLVCGQMPHTRLTPLAIRCLLEYADYAPSL